MNPEKLFDAVTIISAAYMANQEVRIDQIPIVVEAVRKALTGGETAVDPEKAAPDPLVPAVAIKRSVTPNAIYSLEDGKPYKTLRRHLSTRGMTPDQYRAKWGLKPDYPMTAPNYSAARSALAKEAGLGQRNPVGKRKR